MCARSVGNVGPPYVLGEPVQDWDFETQNQAIEELGIAYYNEEEIKSIYEVCQLASQALHVAVALSSPGLLV